ncbi:transposase [Candidatus Dependentiae bacterium]|nr:transposase [Candidatus Dependentiae bacterium]
MSRQARIDLPDFFYHIYCRGQRKQPLFFSERDFYTYIWKLKSILKEIDIDLYAFCLMMNHLHLLIYRNEDSLAKFQQMLNIRYAKYFNEKYNLVGYLFQGRYKSKIVLNQDYLMNLLVYIHQNPVKAGIVKNESDYKFSSAAFYHGLSKFLLPIKKIPILSGSNSVEKYLKFLRNGDYEYSKYRSCIGSKEEYMKFEKRKAGREKGFYINKRKIVKTEVELREDFLKLLKEITNLEIKDFVEKGVSLSKIIRNKIIYNLFRQGYNKAQIARFFDLSIVSVFRIIKKFL